MHSLKRDDRPGLHAVIARALATALMAAMPLVAGCGTPKKTVEVFLGDSTLSDYEMQAMKDKYPGKSEDDLQDQWDKMTKAQRSKVVDEYMASKLPKFDPNEYYKQQLERMAKEKNRPGGGGGGGGGGGD